MPLHALGLRIRFVDLVDRNDYRHIRRARVRNRFFGLRHNAVVCRYNEHNDIRHLRAARTHPRERFVARRIDKYDPLSVDVRLVRANVLRDAARFPRRHVFRPNGVQQARLAVVHVSHHRDHRCARHFIARALFLNFFLLFLDQLLFERHHLNDAAERFRQTRCRGNVERLVDARKYAAIKQRLQQFLRANIEFLREFANRDAFGHRNQPRFALHRSSLLNGYSSTRTRTCARTNRMQLPLAFRVTLLN